MPSHLLKTHHCSSKPCVCSDARTPSSYQGEQRLLSGRIISHHSILSLRGGILQRVTWSQMQGLATRGSPGFLYLFPPKIVYFHTLSQNQIQPERKLKKQTKYLILVSRRCACSTYFTISFNNLLYRWYFSQGKCQR